jgi:nucleotide-binding universal stress UspA family protein
MYRSILVPLDGSRRSEQALRPASALAAWTGAQLRLAMVDDGSIFPTEVGWPAAGPHADSWQAQDEAYLRRLVERVAERSGVRARWALLEGPVVPALHKHALETGCDLVVMATHGRGGVERAWLGSVADEMVRAAGLPILLVRPEEHLQEAGGVWAPRRLLVPLDGSTLAESVLPHAVGLARASGAALRLVRVVPPPTPRSADVPAAAAPPPSTDELERCCLWALRYLERAAAAVDADAVEIATSVVAALRPAYGIISEAADTHADLIVMATHGHGGWRRLVLGSVSDKVLRGSSVPVLVMPPAGPTENSGTSPRQSDVRWAKGKRRVSVVV